MRNDNQASNITRESKRKSKKKKILIVTITLLVIICLAAVAAVWGYSMINKKIDKIDYVETPQGNEEFGIDDKVAADLKDYENIAILGVDDTLSESNKFDGARSDAIIIASIHKTTGDVLLTSVMRDTLMEIQDKDGDYKLDKITHAHALGGGLNTCRALNRNLDLNITKFVIFNWESVADLVDSMGGIELDIKANELYDLNETGQGTAIVLGTSYTKITQPGIQTLDGVQVAAYCRIRHNSGGDEGRTERARATLAALFVKAKTLGLSELNSVADDSLPGIRTNMTNKEIFASILDINKYKLGTNRLFPYELYGGMIGEVWYAVPLELGSNVSKLHLELFQQVDYIPTDTVMEINEKIIEKSGKQLPEVIPESD
jgi:polyisoprenyl-teichoic acid--peptidoglycan teichoic acid transferase